MEQEISTVQRLGEFVRAKRKELKLSLRDLSLAAYDNVFQASWLCKLENGKVKGVSSRQIDKLLALLDTEKTFFNENK